jgi:hypothetical protein
VADDTDHLTPAVKAGLTDHVWTVEELVALLEKSEPKSTRPARGWQFETEPLPTIKVHQARRDR